MPGYKDHRNDVRDAGIDEVLVYCVNDAAVMEAWAKNQRIAGTNITFLADPSMVLTEALDMVRTARPPLLSLASPSPPHPSPPQPLLPPLLR